MMVNDGFEQKEICLYTAIPMDKRDIDRFGVNTFNRRGWKVSQIVLRDLLFPGVGGIQAVPGFLETISPKNFEDLDQCVKSKRQALAFVFVNYSLNTEILFRTFKKWGVRYVFVNSNPFPFPNRFNWKKLYFSLGTGMTRRMVNRLWFLLFRQFEVSSGLIEPPHYILAATDASLSGCPPSGPDTKIIWAHTFDYDHYLADSNCEPAVPGYGVFLDGCIPFHPDYLVCDNSNPQVDPKAYYQGITRFFDHVEKATGVPIVVAAHPRSSYEGGPDYFQGRRIERGNSAQLVARSQFVIAQYSNSINFPVIYRKPIIFITSDMLEKTHKALYLRHYAMLLGKKTINVDSLEIPDFVHELKIDEVAYERYFENYVKKRGTPEKSTWDILLDELEGQKASRPPRLELGGKNGYA